MRRLMICAGVIGLGLTCLAAGPAQRDGQVAYFGGSLYQAFRNRAGVYLGTVGEFHPSKEDSGGMHIGQATFKVDQVIHGATTQSVQLRYIYPQTPLTTGTADMVPWPNLEKLAPNTQFVVVAMRSPAPALKSADDSTPAALGVAQIHVVSGPDDPIVLAYVQADKLYATKGDALRDGLMQAAAGTQPVLNDYAADAARTLLKGSDRVDVMAAAVAHYTDLSYPTRYMGDKMDALAAYAESAQASDEDRKLAVKTFAAVIASGSTNGSSAAYRRLGPMVARPAFQSPRQFLSTDEESQADAAMAALTNLKPVGFDPVPVKAIRDWLAKDKPGLAPATRP